MADMALEILDVMERIGADLADNVAVRIGIHTGPAVAGVIGTRKLFYDVWGEQFTPLREWSRTGVPAKFK